MIRFSNLLFVAQLLPASEGSCIGFRWSVTDQILKGGERPSSKPLFLSWPAGLRDAQCEAGVGGWR